MKYLLTILALVFTTFAKAQNADDNTVLPLEKEKGNYFVTGTLAGEEMRFCMDTGASALSISEDFFEKHKDELKLKLRPVKSGKAILLGDKKARNILYKGSGRLDLGKMFYYGPVCVLDDEMPIHLVPPQFLQNKIDSVCIIGFDFKKKTMTLMTRASREGLEKGKYKTYKIYRDKTRKPLIKTTIKIKTDKNEECELTDTFMVDLGNGNLLSLFGKNERVDSLVEAKLIEPKRMDNADGNMVGLGVRAKELTIGDEKFYKQVIRFNSKLYEKLDSKRPGLIGAPFFDSTVIFDFGKKKIYYK